MIILIDEELTLALTFQDMLLAQFRSAARILRCTVTIKANENMVSRLLDCSPEEKPSGDNPLYI
jgi:hypothetical protein